MNKKDKDYLMAKEIKNKIYKNTDGNLYQDIRSFLSFDAKLSNYYPSEHHIRRIFDSQNIYDLYSTGDNHYISISRFSMRRINEYVIGKYL